MNPTTVNKAEKARILELIKSADLSQVGWWNPILDSIPNDFARGYLTAYVCMNTLKFEHYHDIDENKSLQTNLLKEFTGTNHNDIWIY